MEINAQLCSPFDEKTMRSMLKMIEEHNRNLERVQAQYGNIGKALADYKRVMEAIEATYPHSQKAMEFIRNQPEGGWPSNICIP